MKEMKKENRASEIRQTGNTGQNDGLRRFEGMDERTLEFDRIIELLRERAVTETAKEQIRELRPELSELTLRRLQRETTEARIIMEHEGNPPLQDLTEAKKALMIAEKDGLLYPEQLERVLVFAASCKRMKGYLKKAQETGCGLAFFGDDMEELEEVRLEINRCIRGGEVDDNASKELSDIRRQMEHTRQQMQKKLEEILKSRKQFCSDSFISVKNGHYTIPVKKEYKLQVPGKVIAASSTGATCFIEPAAAAKYNEKLSLLQTEEAACIERILYGLTALVCGNGEIMRNNIAVMERLDFAFAKGKLSIAMEAAAPEIVTERRMKIVEGRHPLLDRESCVPLDFSIGGEYRGIVITGPNTGGKTVSLKLVGLFSLMAQCGLHLPCKEAVICMNSNVVCDIGDGQNISENLSTFSAHITNIVRILERTGPQTLVLLDELGSGTDPAEGMGIAIAVLEELRNRNCLFVATTHYAEVKTYAERAEGLMNARMTFDRETLKPEYRLVLGEAGESCAFYVAERLGFPRRLLEYAYRQTYSEPDLENTGNRNTGSRNAGNRNTGKVYSENRNIEKIESGNKNTGYQKIKNEPATTTGKDSIVPKITKIPQPRQASAHALSFQTGDSVVVYPEKKIGIVYQPADEKGFLVVQIQGRKQAVNHRRLKLKAFAAELYPEDYDFSILFDTVENRKARHEMERKYSPDAVIRYENENGVQRS